MGKEILTLGGTEIEKNKFYYCKSPIFIDVDIENVLEFNKIFFDEKSYRYFIGYLHDDYKIKTLHTMLPKTKVYVKHYDGQTKWMYFLIEIDNLLEKYNTIWDKVSADIKTELDNKHG